MLFNTISLLCLAAASVHAAAVKRDCVDHVGNSWGCDAPAGTGVANYCIAADASRPICTYFNSGGLSSAHCCS
ncbi:unnamed protein product [Discula destructiva]